MNFIAAHLVFLLLLNLTGAIDSHNCDVSDHDCASSDTDSGVGVQRQSTKFPLFGRLSQFFRRRTRGRPGFPQDVLASDVSSRVQTPEEIAPVIGSSQCNDRVQHLMQQYLNSGRYDLAIKMWQDQSFASDDNIRIRMVDVICSSKNHILFDGWQQALEQQYGDQIPMKYLAPCFVAAILVQDGLVQQFAYQKFPYYPKSQYAPDIEPTTNDYIVAQLIAEKLQTDTEEKLSALLKVYGTERRMWDFVICAMSSLESISALEMVLAQQSNKSPDRYYLFLPGCLAGHLFSRWNPEMWKFVAHHEFLMTVIEDSEWSLHRIELNDEKFRVKQIFFKPWQSDLMVKSMKADRPELAAFIINCPLSSADQIQDLSQKVLRDGLMLEDAVRMVRQGDDSDILRDVPKPMREFCLHYS
ncbi:hypothetical protein MP228_005638 [Amoeboaphelidium protococcarum]|nr:hypothetical protein MP228_005638 [Amoeboaphelidium protococcarum]